jgi:hypothetical protein
MRCSAFGLDVTTSIPLPGRWRAAGEGLPPLTIERARPEEVAAAWSGAERLGWRGRVDGRELIVEHGRGGDLRMQEAPSIDLHLSSDGERLLVAFDEDADRLATVRLLTDSALFTISLVRGHEAMHAGAVATDAGVLAVAGPTGAGKSSTIAALLAAGCEFHSDDVLVLRRDRARILATPGPPLLTLPRPAPAGVGEPVADLGEETWLSVGGAEGDAPLAGILMLEPDPAGPAGWTSAIAQLLRFPRTPERERARFELAADIVASVPTLRAPARSEPPGAVARRAVEWLRSVSRA